MYSATNDSQAVSEPLACDIKNFLSNCQSASINNPFLANKGIRSYGLKEINDNGVKKTLMPIYISDGISPLEELQPVGYQIFYPWGGVTFNKGCKKKGGFAYIKGHEHIAYLCEGYIICSKIHEKTNATVVIGLDAYNLPSVAKNLKSLFPNVKEWIVIGNAQEQCQKFIKEAVQQLNAKHIVQGTPTFNELMFSKTVTTV